MHQLISSEFEKTYYLSRHRVTVGERERQIFELFEPTLIHAVHAKILTPPIVTQWQKCIAKDFSKVHTSPVYFLPLWTSFGLLSVAIWKLFGYSIFIAVGRSGRAQAKKNESLLIHDR
jgi:hypothetical protein